ncbi:MAG: Mrp/NBP35 family ATP-binding protein [Spirochaetota bacterium]|nr:Mrp/NBP35 family ATP-binding protein [Spirochaetota bacterium]
MFTKKKKSANGCTNSNQGAVNMSQEEEKQELKENLERIKHKIVVLSGKGGVGKSTVAVNLAVSLLKKGYKVGLLDIDIHGPSIPKLLKLEDENILGDNSERLIPVLYSGSLKVMSVGFMLGNDNNAVVWRGPLKYGVIKQFLKDVVWGDLDYLVIDSPPGTGDEPLSICQLIENPDGAVIVTTPQDIAILDVKKSITFCGLLNMPVIGVVENMSGFICPHCSKSVDIFKKGGGENMAIEMGVPFLGRIPLDLNITNSGDSGNPYILNEEYKESEAVKVFSSVVERIDNFVKGRK